MLHLFNKEGIYLMFKHSMQKKSFILQPRGQLIITQLCNKSCVYLRHVVFGVLITCLYDNSRLWCKTKYALILETNKCLQPFSDRIKKRHWRHLSLGSAMTKLTWVTSQPLCCFTCYLLTKGQFYRQSCFLQYIFFMIYVFCLIEIYLL